MKCPHCNWETPGPKKCHVCKKRLPANPDNPNGSPKFLSRKFIIFFTVGIILIGAVTVIAISTRNLISFKPAAEDTNQETDVNEPAADSKKDSSDSKPDDSSGNTDEAAESDNDNSSGGESTDVSASEGEQEDSLKEQVSDYIFELLQADENPANGPVGNEGIDVQDEAYTRIASEWTDRVSAYEAEVYQQTAEHFGLTVDEVKDLFLK